MISISMKLFLSLFISGLCVLCRYYSIQQNLTSISRTLFFLLVKSGKVTPLIVLLWEDPALWIISLSVGSIISN